MIKLIKTGGKIVLAGIVAIAILSVAMSFYDRVPSHHDNPKGNTDYVWDSNSVWVKLTEGIAWGRYDDAGYNNPVVIDDPDIIILGSSHMEAPEIFYEQSFCSQLQERVKDHYTVYNLGISGHDFTKLCYYLPVDLEMYERVPRLVVIETTTVNITKEKVASIMNGKIQKQQSIETGFMAQMQKVPFFKTVYHQVKNGLLDMFMQRKGTAAVTNKEFENSDSNIDNEVDESAYDELFSYLSSIEKKYDTQIIIFNHPTETLDQNGDIIFPSDNKLKAFKKYSEKHGISFVDTTDAFTKMYYEDHLVAHGFITGKLCYGHMNANGHRATAEEVYKEIKRLEKEGIICN